MRRIVVHMQTTLNNRIANAEGTFWEPFPWGEAEQAYVNETFRTTETWALSRVMYEAIVPWWDQVAAGEMPDDAPDLNPADHEFAALQKATAKVVFSTTLESSPDREVVSGDLAAILAELKGAAGGDILVSCGPRTLGPLASVPGLIDEYLVVIHPAVLAAGPGMFDHVTTDLALELIDSRVFDGGAVVLRYRTSWPA